MILIRSALQIAATKAPGGIESAVINYAAMFRDVGVRSVCLYRGPADSSLRQAGVAVAPAPDILFSSFGALAPLLGMGRTVTSALGEEPDLVVVHSDRALMPLRAILSRSIFIAPCHSDKARRKRRADLTVTLNPAQQARVSEQLQGAPSALLGNPFVPGPLQPGAVPSAPRVIFCARLTDIKDPLTFVSALPLVRRAGLDVAIIGSGPLETEVRAAVAALPPAIRVEMPGWRADPWADVSPDDILVLPSHWEGLPYLLLEALHRGQPIIAADNAGNRAALGDGAFGRLFPIGDASALAAAIDLALAEPDAMKAMAQAGGRYTQEHYGARGFWARLNAALAEAGRVDV